MISGRIRRHYGRPFFIEMMNHRVNIAMAYSHPGRNVTKYHNNASNCNIDDPRTRTYPLAPPAVNVKYIVSIIDPK